jgi:hypothetical protein
MRQIENVTQNKNGTCSERIPARRYPNGVNDEREKGIESVFLPLFVSVA